jgi:phage terminase small subunit
MGLAMAIPKKPPSKGPSSKKLAIKASSPKGKLLGNARHELFAQEIAKGNPYSAAYVKAGYKPSTSHASHLAHKPHIQARIRDIVGKAAAKTDIKVERILEELARIGFANMLDYVAIGQGGDANLDLTGLTRDAAAAISEIVVDTHNAKDGKDTVVVRRVRFKLLDKRAALVDLGKHLGMFKERAERADEEGTPDSAPAETPELSPLQIGRRIAFALERAKREKADGRG